MDKITFKNGSQPALNDVVLNQLQTNMGNAVNKLGEEINKKITNLSTYSTEEVKTGETWIDGKPIYRKVFEFTSDTEQQMIPHNIADVEHIWVSGDSFLYVGDNTSIPANYYRDSGIYTYAHANLNNIFIRVSPPGWKGNKFYIVLEYTKKTD